MLDTTILVTYQFSFSGALTRALQGTKDKQVWLPIYPRNVGSQLTVRPPVRPHHRDINVK